MHLILDPLCPNEPKEKTDRFTLSTFTFYLFFAFLEKTYVHSSQYCMKIKTCVRNSKLNPEGVMTIQIVSRH